MLHERRRSAGAGASLDRVAADERARVAAAARGDEAAFAGLLERYGDAVLALCYASTLDRGEAEDLTQEVFVAAWRALPRFRGDAAFSTWLFAIARRACIDRARRRRPPALPLQGADGALAHDAAGAAATRTRLLSAVGELSPALRETLLLREVQGLSYDEIADVQGVPLGTVRSRLAAARRAVADRLGA